MKPEFARVLAIALGVLLVPHASLSNAEGSDDVSAQLQSMQERLMQLEDKLDATEDQLDAANTRMEEQEDLIQDAGIAKGSSSGVSDFVDSIEIGGWISASWMYNFNDPDGRVLNESNTGAFAYPFRPDSNSFSVDQLWFELERPVDEENRAGFRADIVMGKDAGLLSKELAARDGFSGNDLEMYQAYIQYLADFGEGIHFKFGKFATLLGAEVVQAPYNFNITRGHIFQLFQPITHTGIVASTTMAGLDFSLGAVNETRSFPARDIDLNNDKAITWSVGGSAGETVGWAFNGITGSSDSGQGSDQPAGERETILDLILSFDPNESFSSYINADYIRSEGKELDGGETFDGFGIAAAGRYAITERTGVAMRGEWFDLDFDDSSRFRGWGLTGTVDYKLTSKLIVRGELRYDKIDNGDENFIGNNSSCAGAAFSGGCARTNRTSQTVAGVEAIYTF